MIYESKYRGKVLLSIFITYISFIMKVWPLCCSWLRTSKVLLWTTFLQDTLCKRARVWNSKWIMKINTYGNTPMEGIVTFTMFHVYTQTSFLASLSGHSSSYIELQQNAIEWVFLWLTHNTQELVINMFNHNSQELYLWPVFYTSKTCITFIHELDIPVFFSFAFILLTV
jgi:hypothetical protein